MNEAIHFLKAISKGEPNADLIYADWLEEQGRPEADEIRDPAPVALKDWVRSQCCSASLKYYFPFLSSVSRSSEGNAVDFSYSDDTSWSISESAFGIRSCSWADGSDPWDY